MAYNGNEDLQMTIRRLTRVDYELLNGGPNSPEGVLPSDRITESNISQFFFTVAMAIQFSLYRSRIPGLLRDFTS